MSGNLVLTGYYITEQSLLFLLNVGSGVHFYGLRDNNEQEPTLTGTLIKNVAGHQAKHTVVLRLVFKRDRLSSTNQQKDILRVSLHERQNKLIPV